MRKRKDEQMTNYHRDPQPFHHTQLSIIAKNRRNANRRALDFTIKAIYQTDPILWAVIKGHDTEEALEHKFFRWAPSRLQRAINNSISTGNTKRHGSRILPAHDEHKLMKKNLKQRTTRPSRSPAK